MLPPARGGRRHELPELYQAPPRQPCHFGGFIQRRGMVKLRHAERVSSSC